MNARPTTLRICPISPSHACAQGTSERRLILRRSFLALLALSPFAACATARASAPIVTARADVLADCMTIAAYPAGLCAPIFWVQVVTPENVRAALVDEAARFERLGLVTLIPEQAEIA